MAALKEIWDTVISLPAASLALGAVAIYFAVKTLERVLGVVVIIGIVTLAAMWYTGGISGWDVPGWEQISQYLELAGQTSK